jgi:hypothetical protein
MIWSMVLVSYMEMVPKARKAMAFPPTTGMASAAGTNQAEATRQAVKRISQTANVLFIMCLLSLRFGRR